MALHLHRAQRSDALIVGLADVLRTPLPDPMATEIVAVPAKGIERWITQRLAHQLGTGIGTGGGSQAGSDGQVDNDDGVCANVDFSSPTRLMQRVASIASGIDPDTDPWQVQRMAWPLLAVIDQCVTEPWCAALADHLGAGSQPLEGKAAELRRSRRLAVAGRLAGLFDSYSAFRPKLLQEWAAGANTDGYGTELAPQRWWQPELYRRVRTAIGVPSPAERLDSVCRILREKPELLPLPARLSVFGPTRLSAQELAVLDAVAQARDVHIWIPQPSPTLWAALTQRNGTETDRTAPIRRRSDPTVAAPRHPLLRSLGRDSREFQLRLMSCHALLIDHLHPELGRSNGVLGRLQHDLAGDVEPAGQPLGGAHTPDPRPKLRRDDHSIQVHACHGRERQVEVLRDVLVGLLADDPTLQPRDMLVMCPDIEMYAPLILAAFGAPGGGTAMGIVGSHPGTGIRVRLADRALRRTNPVLDVLARLLELADSRMSASQVLDFAALAPVRRRFGFDDDDLQRLREWVIASGVRWGLNDRGRAEYGLAGLKQNTWRTGLDRILLGVAMSEDEPHYLSLALPLDDVDSSDIDLAGRLAELIDRLALAARDLTTTRPLAQWIPALGAAIESLATVRDSDSWQLDQALRTLRDTSADAGRLATTVPLRLADVNNLLADALRGRPTRANFRSGELTICSMVPMRSVPHRVVCLLGLDDGEFPRTGRVDGDDVLALEPVVGERDRTSEDRQLLLDAINAATEYLVFLYSGADDRTGALRPPAAALGEVLDVLDATVRSADGAAAREQLLMRHPLQPHDSANFTSTDPAEQRSFSFDGSALAGARVALIAGHRDGAAPGIRLLNSALPPRPRDATVELAELIRFFEHPAKAFLRDRLGLSARWAEDDVEDELAIELNSLQRWAIGERLLQQQLSGTTAADAVQAEFRRGTLPPGRQATVVLRELSSGVAPLVARATDLSQRADGPGEQHDVNLYLGGSRVLTGTVGPVRGQRLTTVTYSKLGPKQRIRAWLNALALAASDPGYQPMTMTIGRGGKYQPVQVSSISAPSAAAAQNLLQNLIEIRDLGLNIPLPLPPKSAMTYVQARRHKGRTPEQATQWAARDWNGDKFPGEGADTEHQRLWGIIDFAEACKLLGAPIGPTGEESTRWGELATAVWGPLLDAEVIQS